MEGEKEKTVLHTPWAGLTLAGKRDWILGGIPVGGWGSEDMRGPSTQTAEGVEWCPCYITGVWPIAVWKKHWEESDRLRAQGRPAGDLEIVDCSSGIQIVCIWLTEWWPTTIGSVNKEKHKQGQLGIEYPKLELDVEHNKLEQETTAWEPKPLELYTQ